MGVTIVRYRSLSIAISCHESENLCRHLSPSIKKSSLSVQKTIRQQSVSIEIPATCPICVTKSPA